MAREKLNKKCIICGTAYSYCPACGADRKKPSWYMIFDGDNCNNIYNIVTGYRDGKYTVKEANELLKECDLSKIDNEDFNETTRRQIKEILGIDEIATDAVEELIGEVANDVPTDEVPVDETVVEEVVESDPKVKQDVNKNNNYYNKHFKKNK